VNLDYAETARPIASGFDNKAFSSAADAVLSPLVNNALGAQSYATTDFEMFRADDTTTVCLLRMTLLRARSGDVFGRLQTINKLMIRGARWFGRAEKIFRAVYATLFGQDFAGIGGDTKFLNNHGQGHRFRKLYASFNEERPLRATRAKGGDTGNGAKGQHTGGRVRPFL